MTGSGSAAEAVDSFVEEVGRTDVWLFDRTDPAFSRLASAGPASPDERKRAQRLKLASGREFFLARRAAVRRILGLYLNRAPEAIRLVTLPGGKPTFLPGPGDARRLSYSSSQSGDAFCLAVGTATSLGVDIETMRDVPRSSGIAERWFSPEEVSAIDAGVLPGRLEDPGGTRVEGTHASGDAVLDPSVAFLRLWTAKEALAKRHSAGLRLLRRGAGELDVLTELRRGTLAFLRVPAGCVAALATTSPIDGVRLLARIPLPE